MWMEGIKISKTPDILTIPITSSSNYEVKKHFIVKIKVLQKKKNNNNNKVLPETNPLR